MIWRWYMHEVVLRLPDSWSNWNLKMLTSEERGKPEYPEKNPSEQRRELLERPEWRDPNTRKNENK